MTDGSDGVVAGLDEEADLVQMPTVGMERCTGSIGVLGESLALGRALGLDDATAFEVLAATPLGAQADRQRPSLESGDYPPPFQLSLARRDADLILDAARDAGIDLRLAEAAHPWLADAEQAGRGDHDYSSTRPHRRGLANAGDGRFGSPGGELEWEIAGAWRSLVSALVWGTRGPEFKSRRPDVRKAPLRRGFLSASLARSRRVQPSRSPRRVSVHVVAVITNSATGDCGKVHARVSPAGLCAHRPRLPCRSQQLDLFRTCRSG